MIRAEAGKGRTFLWYTTEMDELQALRPCLCLPQRAHRGRSGARRADRGEGAAFLLRGSLVMREGISPQLLFSPRVLRSLLPALSLIALLAAIFYLQPRAMSYFGLNLLLNLAVPIALATIAQMFVITVNDLDLSIGAYVGFVACVAATWLNEQPLLGIAVLLARHRRLCRARRPHLSAQPALDRRHAGHVLRLAGPLRPGAADARRPGAGLAAGLMRLKTPFLPFAIFASVGLGARRASRPDALGLWRGLARRRRQCPLGRARRLVGAEGQDDHVRARRLLRRAGRPRPRRPHHLGRRQYRAALYAALGRRRHPGRRRVRRRPGLAHRGGDRRDHPDAGRLLPLLPAPQPRLADRRPGRDPDPGAGAAPAGRPARSARADGARSYAR